jgi:hypothetical protein
VSKPGVIALARLGGVAVIPIGVAARPALRLRSWDRLLLPLPFAAVAFCFGDPIRVSRDTDASGVERARRALDLALAEQTNRAEAALAGRGMP